MNKLEKVLASNMCCGCGLCVGSQEDMKVNEQGFARPVKQIFDELSYHACPGIKVQQLNHESYDISWGPILSSRVGYSSDPSIRKLGSSGGVLTALLTLCLSEKIVDAVIQTGASIDNPVANITKIITNKEEVVKNAGSRYAPSSPLAVIRQVKGNGKKYAFVGKPCDVAALRTSMRIDMELNEQFPVLLSFMCAGVPSEYAANEVVRRLGLTKENVVDFRYRGNGWPGLTKAVTTEGEVRTMTYNESWGTILNKQLQVRCKVCADGIGELADIACADAWHESENGYPSFEESEGRSLILVRTLKGKALFEKAIGLGYIDETEDFRLETLKSIQPYQFHRKRTSLAKLYTLKLFGSVTPKFIGFSLFKLLLTTPLIEIFKVIVGTVFRKLRGRM